jgi:hypothetical protein
MEINDFNLLRDRVEQMRKHGDIRWQYGFEELDVLRAQGILFADRHCRKLKCGNVPWSPAIQSCMTLIRYLQCCRLKFVYHRNINSRTLLKLFKKTNLEQPILTGAEASEKLKEAFNQFNLLKSNASHMRNCFLEELAERQAIKGNLKLETVLKQLKLREEQRSIARATKRVLRQFRPCLTAIEIQDADGSYKIHSQKDIIENECIRENVARFTQASHLPIMQPPTFDF